MRQKVVNELKIQTKTDLLPIDVEGVVVKSGVSHQAHPLVPARRDVVAMVFVQIFAKIPFEVSGEID